MDGFKRSYFFVTSIHCDSAGDMVLNPTLDVLYIVTRSSCNIQVENKVLIYLNVFKIVCMQEGH